jgi:hypothetical protein
MSSVEIDISDLFDNGLCIIRMTPDKKAAAIDIVMLATGKDNHDSAQIIRKLEKSDDVNIANFFIDVEKYQFSGPGQRKIYILDASEAIELLMMLPGKKAKAFRRESAALLTRLFSGDPTLHDLLDKNALSADPMDAFLGHMKDVAPAVMASVKLGEGGETEAHDECKHWIAANINSIAFATAVCPTCSTPILGLAVAGGLTAVEHIIPGTNYRADVLVRLDGDTHVAIEVAHTHLISAKKMFECKQAGNTVYEVETKEIKRAIMEHQPFSTHVLYTTCTESVTCSACCGQN